MKRKNCFYCNAKATKRLKIEEHHVLAKINSDIIVNACIICHGEITSKQNSLPPKSRSKNATKEKREQFMLLSLGAHLQKLGEELERISEDNHE